MNEHIEEFPSLEEFAPDQFLQKLNRLSSLYRQMGEALGVERQICQEERRANMEKDPPFLRRVGTPNLRRLGI